MTITSSRRFLGCGPGRNQPSVLLKWIGVGHTETDVFSGHWSNMVNNKIIKH
jgi:hypothetical protein